ncbi:MAG TPA: hypothetical protein VK509_07515, partial [Polyangiales bacterium]|nr:hypothetical protein [Polyangiales bacterium]
DRAHINERPGLTAEMSGIRFADLTYERVNTDVESVLDALQLGSPVVIGMEVGNVFVDHMGEDTIPAPSPREVMLGGHAMLVCGQDRFGERVRIANSWGDWYGDKGFAWLASEWLERPSSGDFWALVPKQQQGAE